MFPGDTPACLDYVRRAERQSEPDSLGKTVDLLELPRPRYYGSSGHGSVVLGPSAYLEPHSLGHIRLQIGAGGTGELVCHDYLDLTRKFIHDPGVELAEQPVDVSGGAPSRLVLPGCKRYDVDVVLAHGFQEASRDAADAGGQDLLRVPHPYLLQPLCRLRPCYAYPGH